MIVLEDVLGDAIDKKCPASITDSRAFVQPQFVPSALFVYSEGMQPNSTSLANLPVFKGLTKHEIEEIVQLAQVQRLERGDILCAEGDVGDAVLFVQAGKVRILKRTAQKDHQILAELDAPTVIGEMALLNGAPRSATVQAVATVLVHRVSCVEFERLRLNWSRAAYKVVRNLALTLCERLRDTNEKIDSFFADPQASLAFLKKRQQRLWEKRLGEREET